MDFLFIALYWSTFVLLGRAQGGKLFLAVCIAISIAALFDIWENVLLLSALRAVANNAAQFSTPVLFSRIKWAAFAVALVLMGVLFARAEQPWLRAMSAFMFLAALLTAAGLILDPRLLLAAILSLFVALVIALVYYFPSRPISWDSFLTGVEFVYLIRFQLIALALLIFVLPVAYFLTRPSL